MSGGLGAGGVPGAEAAPKFEVLALGRFDGLPQGLDFVAVPFLEFGELGGKGADDAAGRVVGRLFCRLWRVASVRTTSSKTPSGANSLSAWRRSRSKPSFWAASWAALE